MDSKIRAIVVGLGPLGENLTKELLKDTRFKLVSLIDKDPSKLGTKFEGLTVTDSISSNVDIAFVTTSSKITQIKSLLENLSSKSINVISSCEELLYPWLSNPELAKEIDELAIKNQIQILGTGINPGFLMDYFLITLAKSQILSSINSISYTRIINTNKRRIPFQNKVGVGLNKDQFETAFNNGKIGHVGYRESIDMLTHFLGWQILDYQEAIDPIFKNEKVIGINQTAKVLCNQNKSISFTFDANSQNDDRDLIKIDSESPLDLVFTGGVNGEKGTCAMLINSGIKLLQLEPGFKSMMDL